jgi:SOS-response transcriptional repressor LexA
MNQNIFAFTVHGEAMMPTIKKGDKVFIGPDPDEEIKNGDICIAFVGDNFLVRRFFCEQPEFSDTIQLKADNPAFPEVTVVLPAVIHRVNRIQLMV